MPLLRYVVANVETTLATTDESVWELYAGMVEDPALRERFLDKIRAEFHRSREMIASLYGQPFAERRPRLARSLDLRSQALRRLHGLQVDLITRWRKIPAQTPEWEQALLQLLVTVNAIASGLRTTG